MHIKITWQIQNSADHLAAAGIDHLHIAAVQGHQELGTTAREAHLSGTKNINCPTVQLPQYETPNDHRSIPGSFGLRMVLPWFLLVAMVFHSLSLSRRHWIWRDVAPQIAQEDRCKDLPVLRNLIDPCCAIAEYQPQWLKAPSFNLGKNTSDQLPP